MPVLLPCAMQARHEVQVRRLPTVELAEQLGLGPGAPKRCGRRQGGVVNWLSGHP